MSPGLNSPVLGRFKDHLSDCDRGRKSWKSQYKCRAVINERKSLRELLVSGPRLNSLFPEQIHFTVCLCCTLIPADCPAAFPGAVPTSSIPGQAGIKALGAASAPGARKANSAWGAGSSLPIQKIYIHLHIKISQWESRAASGDFRWE